MVSQINVSPTNQMAAKRSSRRSAIWRRLRDLVARLGMAARMGGWRARRCGLAGPTYMDCGHETLAVGVAVGYTQVTGRMQAVLLHAGSGLLQGAMGLQGAARPKCRCW